MSVRLCAIAAMLAIVLSSVARRARGVARRPARPTTCSSSATIASRTRSTASARISSRTSSRPVVEGLTITDETDADPAAARVAKCRRSRTAASRCGPMAAWTSPGSSGPDITWHDGKPFTSADVKFTVDAINDPSYNPESTDGFDRISVGGHARSADRDRALPRGLCALRAAVRPRLSAASTCSRGATSIAPSDYNRSLLGTGPYRVAEWKTGEYILLERVPTYWRGTPKIAQAALQVPVEHQHAHQSAQVRRGAHGGDSAVGQVPRDGGGPGPRRSIAPPATPTSTSRSTSGGSPPSPTFACGGR